MLGRPLLESEVEPLNWAQAEYARKVSGVDYANALAATAEFRRAIQQWWADGWDLLLTPTLGEPPLRIGELDAADRDPLEACVGRRRSSRSHPRSTPAASRRSTSAALDRRRPPIGIQLVAAYGREDVLIRVASQLERAQPWADRRPT